jgi:alkylated DNA repair dioxygenase AlkB
MQASIFDGDPDCGPNLLSRDGKAIVHHDAINPRRASELFAVLASSLAWKVHTVFVFGRWVEQPRLTAWYGNEGVPYRYSGSELRPHSWTPELVELREICEQVAGARFNSVLANQYRHGNDSVAWHADNEPELGVEPVIASVSLGAERRFDLRHRATGETVRVPLRPGSVLVMSGRTQEHWVHQVAKTRRPVGSRINLTFRWIHA